MKIEKVILGCACVVMCSLLVSTRHLSSRQTSYAARASYAPLVIHAVNDGARVATSPKKRSGRSLKRQQGSTVGVQ
jgi:hypothetical protein